MNKILEYVNNIEKKQLIMLYLIILFIGYMIFNAFVPEMMDKQESLQNDIETKQMKILNNSVKKLNAQVKKFHMSLLEKKEELRVKQEDTNHYIGKLYQIQFAFFREIEFAKSLDLMLKESLKQNIQLNFIKNIDLKVSNLTELIQYKKSIQIDGDGRYANILQFIHFIEQQELLMNLHDITFKEDTKNNTIHFSLMADFYGVGL